MRSAFLLISLVALPSSIAQYCDSLCDQYDSCPGATWDKPRGNCKKRYEVVGGVVCCCNCRKPEPPVDKNNIPCDIQVVTSDWISRADGGSFGGNIVKFGSCHSPSPKDMGGKARCEAIGKKAAGLANNQYPGTGFFEFINAKYDDKAKTYLATVWVSANRLAQAVNRDYCKQSSPVYQARCMMVYDNICKGIYKSGADVQFDST